MRACTCARTALSPPRRAIEQHLCQRQRRILSIRVVANDHNGSYYPALLSLTVDATPHPTHVSSHGCALCCAYCAYVGASITEHLCAPSCIVSSRRTLRSVWPPSVERARRIRSTSTRPAIRPTSTTTPARRWPCSSWPW